jgi:hypothetical protein
MQQCHKGKKSTSDFQKGIFEGKGEKEIPDYAVTKARRK